MSFLQDSAEFKTDAGTLVFRVRRRFREEGVTEFDVSCDLEAKFASYLPKSFIGTFYRGDLSRFANYLEGNCGFFALKEEAVCSFPKVLIPSPRPFLTHGLEFTVRAMGGDIYSWSEGELNILFLINCGPSIEGAANSYFGFQSCMALVDLREFCDSIRKVENEE